MRLFTFSSNNHESQRAWVKKQLEKRGVVTRNKCLNRVPAITRLSSIIFRLKAGGMIINPKSVGNDFEYHKEKK